MRHGRKSRSVRVDGYKRHVLHDLDAGLIRAVGITAANMPEASVTREISADLEQQGVGMEPRYPCGRFNGFFGAFHCLLDAV